MNRILFKRNINGNIRHLVLNLVSFFLCLIPLFAQDSKIKTNATEEILTFHLLDVESGLSHNVVNNIEQDSLGFMWVGTIEGVNRYDGTRFSKFKKDYKNPESSLNNNHISQIEIDLKGNILISSDEGLNTYSTKHETFEAFKVNNKKLVEPISSFAIGPNRELIIGSSNKEWGLRIIDKNGKLTTVSHEPNNPHSISSNYISKILVQGDSILWIGTSNFGLNKYSYKTKKITRVPSGKNSTISSVDIHTLYNDNNGNLWIGGADGLQVITPKGDTLSLKSSLNYGRGLSDENVLSFEEDNDNKMWIGTRNGGLNLLDIPSFISQQKLSIKWFLPKSDGSSVYNRTITSIKKDREGNMWLGTSTGLNFVNPNGEPIKRFQKNIDNPDGLAHDRIGAFAQKSDGKIWIGTDGAGLNLYNPNTGKFSNFKHEPNNKQSLSNDYIIALLDDSKNRLWVGTYGGGLNKRNPLTGNYKHYLEGNIEDGNDVRKIYEDGSGQIWVGTNRGGLFKYNEAQDAFNYISSLGKIDIRDITCDEKGFLWLATYGDGVLKYNPKNDSTVAYNMKNTEGMTSDVVFCFLRLNNGDMLCGTRFGGLVRINPDTHMAVNFTEYDGLSNNTVSSMVFENDNSVWIGTFNGISHYNTHTDAIENLNTFNNIQRSEFNVGAAIKSYNNDLYFGGNKGFNMFNPKKLENNTPTTYSIVFENIHVLNKKVIVDPNSTSAILKESISYQNSITLPHNQSLFSINFTVLKYPIANNINYSYILEGYHNHWIENNSNGTANLSNIPPGDYTLKVKAKLGSGKEVYNQLLVTITPPFWKTIPAYILYLLFSIAAIYLALKYYTNHLKLKNSLLFEKKQRQLEQDFNKERIRFFTSFSHELRTPLTLILGPVDDMLQELNNKKHLDRMRLIKKNATYLFQSINKLLEFRKSEIGLSDLVVNKYNLPPILKQLVDNYVLMAQKKDINLTHTIPDEDFIAWFDLEKVQIIVNNLLSNAIKHSAAKGNINVALNYDENNFKIIVKDDGSGIHPEDFSHIFEWYYQSKSLPRKKGSGIGLALSKNFAELHKGQLKVESSLGSGSTFTLEIPRDETVFINKPIDEHINAPLEEVEMSPVNAWAPLSEKITDEKKKINVTIDEDKLVVLVIDDNPDILQYLEGVLEKTYDIIYAENGQEGIEKALKYVPDLIISDIMMPKKSGIDLCEVLKNETTTTHIPIILLSAKSNEESIKEGYETGADDYIIKPFNSQILLARVKNLIDSRKSLRKYFLEQEEPLQSISKDQSKLLDKEKEFLRKLETIILNSIKSGKANVKDITNEMGMSRTPLFRKIKAITGKNINEYITMVKLKKAASLIKNEDFTISEAAFEVGYNSPKYFRQLFKKQFGTVPSKYKK
ncbi:response regulator [Algibacter amylolyticus]|uniref:histidine kinase n=1 Tax=Algibacter amylolyticus TaxID=1608400 RepID=A0A5M7B2N4_9FLAO|nr:two-component regulator propeller domain-containing protein [Algibacter amylolyticus]KAA5823679.1 response regulator [Algibacter amylolyticus]MBB5267845.1 ligand-binding sensor domain-containing protein/signal transduction histidine kinase/DNA-binding response OmpR family regulator [Algibacter amylolyticus]TSJ74167.1 response regulator [Algibacter amylolyticus]